MMNKTADGTFHGGFVRNRGDGRGVRVARAKASELPVLDPTTVQEAALVAAQGNKPIQARRVKLACLGIPSDILDKGDQEYARCIRLANAYKKVRVKEFFQAHGYVSSGVHALLASSSLAIAASRFIYASAAGNPEGVTAAELKLASSLSDSSRQNELSAWELCAREAVVRKRNDMNSTQLPWLTQSPGQQASPSGMVKRGRGRPRKVALVTEAQGASLTQSAPTERVTDARPAIGMGQIDSSSQEGGGEGPEQPQVSNSD